MGTRLAAARPALALAAALGAVAATERAAAAARHVVERVPSALTPGPVRTVVVLPPSYDAAPARRFGVLYFLHDGRGDENALLAHGIARELHDDMRAGRVPELLLVSPRLTGTWVVDSYDGRVKYASFLGKELVPFVESRYRVRAERGARAVAGISMGGYGAVRWALESPELFAAVGALSPALQQLNWEMLDPLPFFVRRSFTSVFGKDELRNNLRDNDVYDMLLRDPSLAARVPPVFVRCGTEDRYRLAQITGFFGRFLDAMGIEGGVTLEKGKHDWDYWRRALPTLLRTVAARLEGAA